MNDETRHVNPSKTVPMKSNNLAARATREFHVETPSEPDGPPLPPRRSEMAGSNASALMDLEDDKAKSIPSLQPMRRM